MDQNSKRIFEKFWQMTDRGKKTTVSDQLKVNELQNWGVINEIVEKSPTLKALVQDKEVRERKKLPEGRNYTLVLEKIIEELNLSHTKTEMVLNENFKKLQPYTNCVVIKVETTPVWAFDGFGHGVAQATETASKKGVRFLIAVSSDNIVF